MLHVFPYIRTAKVNNLKHKIEQILGNKELDFCNWKGELRFGQRKKE